MMTLDEVIIGIKEQMGLGDPILIDALHYLKEYSSKQDTITEQLAELEQKNDHVCELAKTVCKAYDRLRNRLAEEYRNDALSWDELKTMTGKPVWVECKFYSHQWAIIGEVYENRIRFYGHRLVDVEPRSEIGETWQAYRKERK